MSFSRTFLLSTFLFPLSVSLGGAADPSPPIDVVLDIDGTLLYGATPEFLEIKPESLLEIGVETYRFTDHAVAVVQKLHEVGFRISYFSGGDEARNMAVVDAIYRQIDLQSGEAGKFRPFRVLSAHHLTPVEGAPEDAQFFERFKKDLRKLGPEADLKNAVLVDDNPSPILATQKKNHLMLHNGWFSDVPDYNHWRRLGVSLKYEPFSRKAWRIERKKMVWALGVLMQAKEKMSSEGTSLAEAVHRLTHSGGEQIPFDSPEHAAQIRRGMRSLAELGLESVRVCEEELL